MLQQPQGYLVRKQSIGCAERTTGGKMEGGMKKGFKETLEVMDTLFCL